MSEIPQNTQQELWRTLVTLKGQLANAGLFVRVDETRPDIEQAALEAYREIQKLTGIRVSTRGPVPRFSLSHIIPVLREIFPRLPPERYPQALALVMEGMGVPHDRSNIRKVLAGSRDLTAEQTAAFEDFCYLHLALAARAAEARGSGVGPDAGVPLEEEGDAP